MTQITTSAPNLLSDRQLCFYINATPHIQIAKIMNIKDFYFERVVFPGQRLLFEAPLDSQLTIFTSEISQAIVEDTIPCDRLRATDAETIAIPNDS